MLEKSHHHHVSLFYDIGLFVRQESVTVQSWTSKVPKMAQPDLNFLAPEVQLGRNCCPLSDMFSLGMLVCAVYNGGHSLIAADHNPSIYVKQLDQVRKEGGRGEEVASG